MVFRQMCAFRCHRGRTRGAHGCREACFLRHRCDTVGKKGGGVWGSDGEAAAAPRERSPERELQVQPAGPWASGEKATSVEFDFFPPLASNTCYIRGFSASLRFLANRLLDKRVFDSLSDRSLAETPACDPPAPAQPRCRRRSGPPALLGLFSPLFVSPKPCF